MDSPQNPLRCDLSVGDLVVTEEWNLDSGCSRAFDFDILFLALSEQNTIWSGPPI